MDQSSYYALRRSTYCLASESALLKHKHVYCVLDTLQTSVQDSDKVHLHERHKSIASH